MKHRQLWKPIQKHIQNLAKHSKMELFAKAVNGFSFLTIFAKDSIIAVWQDSEFSSEASNDLRKKFHLRCLTEFWIHLCINYFRKAIAYLFTKFD